MKNKMFKTITLLCLIPLMACTQNKSSDENIIAENPTKKMNVIKQVPHNYGGYYCPDNLDGFPAVDIKDWENVPVVNGRMATREETQNGTSLIFVDDEKYPNAKPLDMKMPKLARFYNHNSGKKELIIVIQALNISNDSIVGFRYLNGGNGSARMGEVKFLSNEEIEKISPSHFVTLDLEIDANQVKVWNVMTKPEYSETLQAIFDKEKSFKDGWQKSSKVNFLYRNRGIVTSEFAGNLYGNQYIQIDFGSGDYHYVEKFMLGVGEQMNGTKMKVVCGPYGKDFKKQKLILNNWAQKVKELSEGL
jgi:hypothetical protein